MKISLLSRRPAFSNCYQKFSYLSALFENWSRKIRKRLDEKRDTEGHTQGWTGREMKENTEKKKRRKISGFVAYLKMSHLYRMYFQLFERYKCLSKSLVHSRRKPTDRRWRRVGKHKSFSFFSKKLLRALILKIVFRSSSSFSVSAGNDAHPHRIRVDTRDRSVCELLISNFFDRLAMCAEELVRMNFLQFTDYPFLSEYNTRKE